jgi:glycosyltransferase involved in cell wall biosynthesis
MSCIKILYITSGLQVGGAEVLLAHVLAQTDRARFAPAVICLGPQGRVGAQIVAQDVPLYVLGMRPGRPDARGLLGLLRAVRDFGPDLIQGWMYHGNLAAQVGAALAARRAPVAWCVHKSVSSLRDEKPATAAVIRLCARLSGLPGQIVYVSEVGRRQHEALGFRPDKSLVISNGIDAELFRPSAAARRALRAELGLPDSATLIGLLARYHPQKDHPSFLRAAAHLAARHQDVHFILAGTQVDPQNPELTRLVAELGLGGRVHLLGERGDMPQLTAGLDIATSASAFGEGLSLALAEAMAAGVPCAVTDVGDSALLVGQTGRVVTPRDPLALAGAWDDLIALGLAGRATLGIAARERVLQRFGIAAMLRSYEQLHMALLEHGPAATPGKAGAQ